MSGFHACTSCKAKLPAQDGHMECIVCLGPEHAQKALTDITLCDICASFKKRTLENGVARHSRERSLMPAQCSASPHSTSEAGHVQREGPTVLEVFNTLLRQLRLSIDYELTGSYDSCINIGSKIIKEHEERQFQEAVIKTIAYQAHLIGATAETHKPSSLQLDELCFISRNLLRLSKLSGQAIGRNLAALVAARRQLWLSQARVLDGEKTALLDAPISPGHTFGPAADECYSSCSVQGNPPGVGSFANTLPTYQRSEVMLFIMGKIPLPEVHPALGSAKSGSCRFHSAIEWFSRFFPEKKRLETRFLRCFNDVGPSPTKDLIISDISVLKLKVDKCSRQDNLFMKKSPVSLRTGGDWYDDIAGHCLTALIHFAATQSYSVGGHRSSGQLTGKPAGARPGYRGRWCVHSQQLYRHIFLACKEENSQWPHFEALYALLAVISMELANEEVVVDLIRLALALQELALMNDEGLPVFNRCAVHALSAAYLNLISQLTTVPAFCQHIHEVIEMRQKEVPYLLPEDVFIEKHSVPKTLEKLEGEVLFLQSKISEVLGGSGYNADRLATPYIPQLTEEDRLSKRKSIGETISLQVEVESRNSPEKEECQGTSMVTRACTSDLVRTRSGTSGRSIPEPPPEPVPVIWSVRESEPEPVPVTWSVPEPVPNVPKTLEKLEGEVLFLQSKISEVLGGSGYNADRLATPYIPQLTEEDRLSKRKSIGETISLQVEVESRNSPEKEERTPAEEITFETLKKAIVDSAGMEEQERERRRQVVEKFQKAPFEEIAAHCGARATLLQSKLNQIFEITIRPPPSPSGTITAGYGQTQSRSVPVYEMKFPDLCVY
ncbi:UNVERIFIED_CONTAM: hypothetical protein FKN15_004522 [Acipenser sinensis]